MGFHEEGPNCGACSPASAPTAKRCPDHESKTAMRAVIATFPSTSHLYPVIPPAWARRARSRGAGGGASGHGERRMTGTITGAGRRPYLSKNPSSATAPGTRTRRRPRHNRGRLRLDARRRAEEPRLLEDRLPSIISQRNPLTTPTRAWSPTGRLRRYGPDLVLLDPLPPPAAVAARVAVRPCPHTAGPGRAGLGVGLASGRSADRDRLPAGSPAVDRYGLDSEEEMLLGEWSVDLVRRPRGWPWTPGPFRGAGSRTTRHRSSRSGCASGRAASLCL